MEDEPPQYLYKETRLNLDPDNQALTVTVRLPPNGLSHQLSRLAHQRPRIAPTPNAEDEAAFVREHLASSASVYFRQRKTYPRSLLWRVLDEGKLVSLTFLDITKPAKFQTFSL